MQLGMIGLGRMGSNMVRRLLKGGHACVVHDHSADARAALEREGAQPARTLPEMIAALKKPRAVWMMVPVAAVDSLLAELVPLLEPGDIVIDGGNTHYVADIERARRLAETGIRYVDCGTSGGVWGLERGYCLMIGGDESVVRHLDAVFRTLAPGRGTVFPTPGRGGSTAEEGYLHCGPNGAGHFVKMIHNGIEYGLMAAYAEGFGILREAGIGKGRRDADAETAPVEHPERYPYDFNLSDIAELWRRGSVIPSWLLDLAAQELAKNPSLEGFSGRVSDSGEGRWTIQAAIDEGVPTPVLAAALFGRFDSQGRNGFKNKVLSALRFAFGGHEEKK